MTQYDVKRLALVLAVQAEIEGMKAENIVRQQQGLTIAYSEESFAEKAMQLTNLAYGHDDQL